MENQHTMQDLKIMQKLPLNVKIRMTEQRIRDWVNEFGVDGVYVSFSGGKDSTVLLDIVRNRMGYTQIPAVFCDTGLEYPEIRDFIKTFDNVVWIKPALTFKQVIQKYGYPFISKEVSNCVQGARKYLRELERRNSILTDRQTDRQTDSIIYACYMADLMGIDRRNDKNNTQYQQLKSGIFPSSNYRLRRMQGKLLNKEGKKSQFNQERYAFFLNAPFEITDYCCNVMKKSPVRQYEKETGRKPIIATMADESKLRAQKWLQEGCNSFQARHPHSKPVSFWTEQDVLRYIKENGLRIASVYGEVVTYEPTALEGQITVEDLGLMPDNRPLKTTGCSRTGCMFCGFGCHLEKPGEGRFERMKITHPKLYDYIMRPTDQGGLGYKEVIDWINEHGNLNIRY